MATLLINPTPTMEHIGGAYKGLLTAMPPIGLALLAARLREQGREVSVFDASAAGADPQGCAAEVARRRPHVVGLPVVTPIAEDVFAQARAIRAANPDVVIVMGNIHADLFADDILREGLADICVHGEAENAIVDIDRAVVDGTDWADILGISYRKGDEVKTTAPRPDLRDLDQLPFPAWDLFPIDKYRLFKFAVVDEPATLICASRGCPYRCTFCSLQVMGKIRRKRSMENLVDEIEWLHEEFGYRQVAFVDPIFPISRKEAARFCELMIGRGLHRKVSWVTETRVDLVDEDMLRMCYEAGLRRVMFGFESGDDELLAELKKKFVVNKSVQAVEACRKTGVQSVGFFMIGAPGETAESIEKTIEFARALAPDFAKFTVFVPYPGTDIYNDLMAEDAIDDPTAWRRYTSYPTRANPPNYLPDGISLDQMIKLHRRAFRRCYVRPSMIWRHFVQIRTITPLDALTGLRVMYGTS